MHDVVSIIKCTRINVESEKNPPSTDPRAVRHLLLGLSIVTLGSIICFHNYLNRL